MAGTSEKRIEELYELISDIGMAMLTTRRPDGRLVTRPMANQKRDSIADLWFVTDVESNKLDELNHDPNVNLGYLDSGSYEWVSVSGTARISTDRGEIERLWQPDWRAFFGKVDDVRDGGPEDPRLALILVEAESVVYQKREKPRPVVLFEVAKGLVTGDRVEIGPIKTVDM